MIKCNCGCNQILKVISTLHEEIGYIDEGKDIIKHTRNNVEVIEKYYCSSCGKEVCINE